MCCRYERSQAEYVEKLPAGKHSCKGIGATCPDPEEKHVLDDGVEVPFGKPKSQLNRYKTSLLYNEYPLYSTYLQTFINNLGFYDNYQITKLEYIRIFLNFS